MLPTIGNCTIRKFTVSIRLFNYRNKTTILQMEIVKPLHLALDDRHLNIRTG